MVIWSLNNDVILFCAIDGEVIKLSYWYLSVFVVMAEESPLWTLVGEEIALQKMRNRSKWSGFVKGKGKFLYGISYEARRVVKFNPVDKSIHGGNRT